MVARIKRQRFEAWWDAKRYEWSLREGDLWEVFSKFLTSERYARIYRRVEEETFRQRPADRVWHATHVHAQYGRRKGHR